ncbi:hypothetical protein [Ruegeria sp. HKCCA5426]|uniref:hypothetical protein n=1 Tax=Ruegeria sp. HKCCA5426 TaxID=2682985 RepID=UPI001488E33E|nr:hypothetical protein [Ruegeria sp. HKCCA5426]
MAGPMIFAQLSIQDMRRTIQDLTLEERGLLFSFLVENCEAQDSLEHDEERLAYRVGLGKSKKSLARLLSSLIKTGKVKATDDGIMVALAENAISHFQTKSENGKFANSCRNDRAKAKADLEKANDGHCNLSDQATSGLSVAELLSHAENNELTLEFDRLIAALKNLANYKGAYRLVDALDSDAAKRTVERWCELELSDDQIVSNVDKVITRKGDGAIISWQYFDRVFLNLAERNVTVLGVAGR